MLIIIYYHLFIIIISLGLPHWEHLLKPSSVTGVSQFLNYNTLHNYMVPCSLVMQFKGKIIKMPLYSHILRTCVSLIDSCWFGDCSCNGSSLSLLWSSARRTTSFKTRVVQCHAMCGCFRWHQSRQCCILVQVICKSYDSSEQLLAEEEKVQLLLCFFFERFFRRILLCFVAIVIIM